MTKKNKRLKNAVCRARAKPAFETHLHADDGVNEKQHDDQQRYVRQCLERFDERPQQRSNALAATQQLDQTHYAKQPEEVNREFPSRFLQSAAVGGGGLMTVGRRLYDKNIDWKIKKKQKFTDKFSTTMSMKLPSTMTKSNTFQASPK